MNRIGLIMAGFLAATPAAMAQQPPDPSQQAFGQEIMECTASKIQLRTQIFTLQAELAKERAAAKTPPPAAPEPPK